MNPGAYSSQGGYSSPANTGNTSKNFGKAFKEKNPKGYSQYTIQQYTPEQLKLLNESYGYVGPESYLGRLAGGDESFYAEQEAPALRQFNELQGNLASRFSGMGMGARNSSGFQNTTNAAAQDFASQLQANRQKMRNQAIADLMGYSSMLMEKKPYEKGYVKKPPTFWQTLSQNIAEGFGKEFGSSMANPVGSIWGKGGGGEMPMGGGGGTGMSAGTAAMAAV